MQESKPVYEEEVINYVERLVDADGIYVPNEDETLPQLSSAFEKRVARARAKNKLARKSRKKNRRKK
jgi:hypothetical protein